MHKIGVAFECVSHAAFAKLIGLPASDQGPQRSIQLLSDVAIMQGYDF